MLIDHLTAANEVANIDDQLWPPLRSILQRAHKFELALDFASVAEDMAHNFATIAHAIPFCRLPYPLVWVEVAQQHRPRFMKADIHIPSIQSIPHRVGFLLSAKDGTDMAEFAAYLFWEFNDGREEPINASYMAMKVDPQGRFGDAGSPNKEAKSEFFNLPNSKEWLAASQEHRNAITNIYCPFIPVFADPTFRDGRLGETGSRLLWEIGRVDWSGEVLFLLGALALLNAVNAVESVPVSMAGQNKGRLKKHKPPLNDYHVLKIAPRIKRHVVQGEGHDRDHRNLRAHMVRGHWKVRRTGIYFWRHHMRGDAAHGTVEKGYEVHDQR